MKQTAVEWLLSNMPSIGQYVPLGVTLEFQAKIDKAKAMEKEQIIQAWDNGFANGYDLGKYNDECSPEDAEQYYTETYESKTNI